MASFRPEFCGESTVSMRLGPGECFSPLVNFGEELVRWVFRLMGLFLKDWPWHAWLSTRRMLSASVWSVDWFNRSNAAERLVTRSTLDQWKLLPASINADSLGLLSRKLWLWFCILAFGWFLGSLFGFFKMVWGRMRDRILPVGSFPSWGGRRACQALSRVTWPTCRWQRRDYLK